MHLPQLHNGVFNIELFLALSAQIYSKRFPKHFKIASGSNNSNSHQNHYRISGCLSVYSLTGSHTN